MPTLRREELCVLVDCSLSLLSIRVSFTDGLAGLHTFSETLATLAGNRQIFLSMAIGVIISALRTSLHLGSEDTLRQE